MLMNDCDKRHEMSVNAIKSSQRFVIEKIGNEWLMVLNSLM